MKWMIASDIHGSAVWCARLLDAFGAQKCDRLLLLGDLLYHGPRNALPDGYDPKKVADMLNGFRDRLLCVRGNCDAEVDQMMLSFPIMPDYAALSLGERLLYATHGHVLNGDNPPSLQPGDVLLSGHTHVPRLDTAGKLVLMNPGSVSIPKENSAHSFIVWEDASFCWRTLENGMEIMRWTAKR